jgi:DNA-3-methyladenine glycosylase II
MLCYAILSQRVPMPVARAMKQSLVRAGGNRLVLDGQEYWAFPEAEQLVGLGEEDLLGLVGNQRKAGYLHALIRHWLELDEGFLRTGPYEQVRERLLQIPGVGPWSASFVLIRGLGRMEHLSADKEMLRAAARVYGRQLGEDEFTGLADRYGDLRGYWGHYLRVAG